jgi:hypothetical protein
LFLFALFEELADLLLHASGDGETARAGVLEHAAEGIEGSSLQAVMVYLCTPGMLEADTFRLSMFT